MDARRIRVPNAGMIAIGGLALLMVASCSDSDGGDEPMTQSSTPELRADAEIVSIRLGEEAPVSVVSLGPDGSSTEYVVVSDEICASVVTTVDGILILAGGEICTETITIEAGELSEEIEVNVVDPRSMDIGDGLLISYANEYQVRWDDTGADGGQDVSFHHPITNTDDGWFALGSDVRRNNDPPYGPLCEVPRSGCSKGVPLVIVKDSLGNGTLAAPKDFEFIWDDRGNGAANRAGSAWKPVCDTGYSALGFVANGNFNPNTTNGFSQPSFDDVRCVRDDFVLKAEIGERFYNDSGSGANRNFAAFEIITPEFFGSTNDKPADREPLVAGTLVGCPNYQPTDCSTDMVNLLSVPKPIAQKGGDPTEPMLTGFEAFDLDTVLFQSSVRIPFTLKREFARSNRNLADDQAQEDFNVSTSPFYVLERVETYLSLGNFDNRQGTTDDTLTITQREGVTAEKRNLFSTTVGFSVSVSGGVGTALPGTNYEATFSTELGWETETASQYSSETEIEFQVGVPAGTFVEVLQVQTSFQAYDASGNTVGAPLTGGQTTTKKLQYPPAESPDNAAAP